MGALLDDARALAVVFADDDDRTASHAGGREVGQGIGGDIGADDGFPGHRAADGIVDRGAEQRGGSGLAGGLLEGDAHGLEHRLAHFGQNIHEMGHRGAGIAADIGHSRLQQRLCDGKDRLALEDVARAQRQLFRLASEGSLHAGRAGLLVDRMAAYSRTHEKVHPGLMPGALSPAPRAGMRSTA